MARSAPRGAATLALACAAALLLVAGATRADDFDYDVSVGLGHSDNIERTHTDEIAETILGVGLDLDYVHEGPRLNADVQGSVDWYDYLENTYDADVVGNVNGTLVYALFPEHFTWAFQDNFGQAQTNPFQPITPENRENINVFSTGPDLMFGMGERYSARLYGRWSDLYYEKNPYDGSRWLGGLTLARSLSPGSSLSLNAVYSDMQYDQQPKASDFSVQQYYLGYENDGARTNLLINLGYRQLDRDSGSSSGPQVEFSLTREMSEFSTATLRFGSEYGDTGQLLTEWQATVPPDAGEGPIVATKDVAQQNYVQGAWVIDRQRTRIAFEAGYNENTYKEQTNYDRNWVTLGLQASRKLRETLSISGGATWYDYTFDNEAGQDYDQLNLFANLNWKPGRAFYASLQLDYYTESSDNPINEYNETRVWLWVGYAPED